MDGRAFSVPKTFEPMRPKTMSVIRLGPIRKRRRKHRSIESALASFSSRLRRRPTLAELTLKRELEAIGVRPRFQSPRIDRRRRLVCILDFLLPCKVVVEVDGG